MCPNPADVFFYFFQDFVGKKYFRPLMRMFINFVALSSVYLINFEMVEFMNNWDRWISKGLTNFLVGYSLVLYWISALKKGQIEVPRIKLERSKFCDLCNRYILKRDHHCPWLGNCVGRHNDKEFFAFLFFQMLCFFNYLTLFIYRMYHTWNLVNYTDKDSLSVYG